MEEWVQRIAIYVILVTVLRSLIGRPQYQQYFRFVSGLILILLLIAPVLHVLGGDSDLYEILGRYLYQQDLEEWESSLQSAEGQMETMIREEYEKAIAVQITELGTGHGLSVQEVSVTLDEENKILALDVHIRSGQETATKAALREFRDQISVYYQIGEESVTIWI